MADPLVAAPSSAPSRPASVGRLSVVICNHDYEAYLGRAVDSALGVEWDDLEVVVVDDGSTDSSRSVLATYGDRIRLLLTDNHGQVSAANTGFAASTGDVVVFLDSDDVLPADMARQLEAHWGAEVSKAQFRMQRVDSDERPLGDPFPTFAPAPTPEQVRRWMTSTTAYPTPPGSGNAYARWFLDRVMPLPGDVGAASDSACLAAAPVLGDVVTVPEVVVSYRQHGGNDSDLISAHGRFAREVERAAARWRFAAVHAARAGHRLEAAALRRSRELLQFRVAAARLDGSYPLPGDGRLVQLVDVLRSPVHPGPESPPKRAAILAWCLLMWAAPKAAAAALARRRWGRQR